MVAGSNPAEPTRVTLLVEALEELPLRDILEVLLGEEGKRRLRLRRTPNQELFRLYDSELVCRLRSERGLKEARRVLSHYKDFLGGSPPTPELAKGFLAQFSPRKPNTIYRYTSVVKGFMEWYGERLDLKVKVPRTLPQYVEDDDVDRLRAAIKGKKTHKCLVVRDLLLVDFADETGLRRAELSNLEVQDLHLEQGIAVVRKGKGGKDGVVPLTRAMTARLKAYVEGMDRGDKVFRLSPAAITNKLRWFSRKAGVEIHPHSLRHHFATKLVERGANIRAVQQLLRHENLSATELYLSLTAKGLREAIDLLEPSTPKDEERTYDPSKVKIPLVFE